MDHTHALDLLGGKETELNFLDGAQGRLRIWEKHVRHDGEVVVTKKIDEKRGGYDRSRRRVGESDEGWLVNVAQEKRSERLARKLEFRFTRSDDEKKVEWKQLAG